MFLKASPRSSGPPISYISNAGWMVSALSQLWTDSTTLILALKKGEGGGRQWCDDIRASLNCHQLTDNSSQDSRVTSLARRGESTAPFGAQAPLLRAVLGGGASRRRGWGGLPRAPTSPGRHLRARPLPRVLQPNFGLGSEGIPSPRCSRRGAGSGQRPRPAAGDRGRGRRQGRGRWQGWGRR